MKVRSEHLKGIHVLLSLLWWASQIMELRHKNLWLRHSLKALLKCQKPLYACEHEVD